MNNAIPILYKPSNKPYTTRYITRKIKQFGKGYNDTIRRIIENTERSEKSDTGLTEDVFCKNIAILMPNFLMTRAGVFKGVGYGKGGVKDPRGVIEECWKAVGKQAKQLRSYIDEQSKSERARVLISISPSAQKEVAQGLWVMFKSLLPVCIGETILGLVGASKVLFAVLPEVSLPVDNAQWLMVFRTVDYHDVILQMASEIMRWEKETKEQLDRCDPQSGLTLPGVYNVMAMNAKK